MRECLAHLVVEAATIPEVQLAPNGRGVVYAVARGSVARNDFVTELYLQRLTRDHEPDGAPEVLSRRLATAEPATFTVRWCPQSDCVSYFDVARHDDQPPVLVRYDVTTQRATRLAVRDSGITGARPAVAAINSDYRWAPSGTMLAFTAPITHQDLDTRRGVNVSVDWSGPSQKTGLFVLEAATGVVTQVTPSALHIEGVPSSPGFAWSPDERAFVVTATNEREGNDTDLFVVDRVSRDVRPLVVQPGDEAGPSWSPDGRSILFSGQRGDPGVIGRLATVPAAGGPVRTMAAKDPRSRTAKWSADSRAVMFTSPARMNRRLFRMEVTDRAASAPLPPATPILGDDSAFISHISVSDDMRVAAFSRSVGASPPELYLAELSPKAAGAVRALTKINASVPLAEAVKVDTISWPSPDGRFTIAGVVLTPTTAWSGDRLTRPLATIVCMKDMSATAELGDAFTWLPTVLRGYAVFIPQVRGRHGAGTDFMTGLRDGKSYVRLPMEDTLAGVDMLIQRGIADPARLGIFGHSQGATQAAGIITMTGRFKAAVVREAHEAELLTREFLTSASPKWQGAIVELQGGGDVYAPAERARLEAESPVYRVSEVRTPTLLLFGVRGTAPMVGRALFNGLQRFRVPSEFVVYDEGHVFTRPSAFADSLVRQVAWFDYWLRGRPYPDAARQREYDMWKREHQSEPSKP